MVSGFDLSVSSPFWFPGGRFFCYNDNMSDLFKNKYRIQTARLRGWDYSSSVWYFVTICTRNRVCYFGDVLRDNDGKYSVALSDIGKIVRDELLKTPKIRLNVWLDEWIIMPNHIHAIFVIENGRDALNASQAHSGQAP